MFRKWVVLLLALSAVSRAQFIPFFLDEAQDAATSNSSIAPGSMFIVKGYFPVADTLRMASLPLATSLDGVSVTVTPASGGEAISAWMVYTAPFSEVSGTQIAAILPSTTPPGDYRITLRSGNVVVGPARARVVERKFRSFSNNQEGSGLAVLQNWVSESRVDRNMFVEGKLADGQTKGPARAGQTAILWGLGLGKIAGADNVAPSVEDFRAQADIRVTVGGVPATVLYAGRWPGFPGIDQINFTLPADAPTGCNVAIQVTVNGSPSNPVTMAIAGPGEDACRHPYLSREQLDQLDAGQAFMAAEFNLGVYVEPSSFNAPLVEIHLANGYFDAMTAGRASTLSPQSVGVGRCTAWKDWSWLDPTPGDSYDGGRVALTGPNINNIALDDGDSYYLRIFGARSDADGRWLDARRTAQYAPGTYSLKGAGGPTVGAFETAVELPPLMKWTNRDEIQSVSRGDGFTVTWTGGAAKDQVLIQGYTGTVTRSADGNETVDLTSFLCAAPQGSTSFTVPVSILGLMAEVTNDGQQSVGGLSVQASSTDATAKFRAPLVGGSETGSGTLGYLFMTQKFLPYR